MSDQSPSAQVVPLRRPAPLASVQGTLALDLEPRRDPPAWEPDPHRADRPVADVISIDDPLRRAVEAWAQRYAQAAVEIVGGDRPVTQLVRWSSREVYQNLHRRALLVAQAGRHEAAQGRVQPVRPRVRSVHACFLSHDTVEVSVHVSHGPRSRALAVRFELTPDRRWRCTALDFS